MVSGAEIVSTPRPEELRRNLDSSGITYNESDGEGMLFAPFYLGSIFLRGTSASAVLRRHKGHHLCR